MMRKRDMLLLAGVMGTGAGCLAEDLTCTPADSTYSCCVKQHPTQPQSCGAEPGLSGMAVATGVLVAAVTMTSDEGVLPAKMRADVEEVLRNCAAKAHETVNHKHFGGEPTRAQCDEVLRRTPQGVPITWAIQLGLEKHEVAKACAEERLGAFLAGRFSLEQRYRYDPGTKRLELVSPQERFDLLNKNRAHTLVGTLEPDVVVHSGDPLKPQAVYDFKFPCLRSNRPRWATYPKGHRHESLNQGEVYQEAFGSAIRVTPWELIR
ncbi:hypothetical protein [Melittangium boletus]|uniref:Putative lipoprotein n=1 Tax=Melittangium boletus DSM 14713 TaxID=1294270 RepID=A0A250IHU9_9BACT|nr:hypothetical protein [Melittangium boletus]ATB30737.1 putative lipoprotein [Melittangium boletus DSM 14713]